MCRSHLIVILSLFALTCTFTFGFASASTYNVDSTEYYGLVISGMSGDEWTIDLNSASSTVNLYIMEEDEYDDIGSWFDSALYVWSATGVTSGEWTWTQPTDEDYVVAIYNPHYSQVQVDIDVYNDTEDTMLGFLAFGSICCILLVVIGFVLLVVLIIIIIVLITRRSKKKSPNEQITPHGYQQNSYQPPPPPP